MVVIIVTVITQGVRVPSDLRGGLRGSLFVKEGVFQAIGVISFGRHYKLVYSTCSMLIVASFRLPYVFPGQRHPPFMTDIIL